MPSRNMTQVAGSGIDLMVLVLRRRNLISADLPGQRLRFQFQRFWNVDHHVDPRAGYLGHVSARHDWPRCHWPSAGTVRGSHDRAALTRRGRDAAERQFYG